MAIMIAPQGRLGKRRSPFGVLLLSIITFGIYYLYWYYEVNCEINRHDPEVRVNAGLALLAQFIPIVATVSTYRTAMRVRRLYMHDQTGGGPSGAVTLLILFLFPIGYPWLVQGGLNEHWEMQAIAAKRLAQQQQPVSLAPPPSQMIAPAVPVAPPVLAPIGDATNQPISTTPGPTPRPEVHEATTPQANEVPADPAPEQPALPAE